MPVSIPFVNGQHSEEDREWCPYDLIDKARNQMEWYLERGEETSELDPKECTYFRFYEVDDHPEDFPDTSLTLYTSTDQPALPRLADSSTIKPLCTIKFRYPLQFDELPILTNESGRTYRQVVFQLKMTTAGSSAKFEVYANNQSLGGTTQSCLGSKEIDVEYDIVRKPVRPASLAGSGLFKYTQELQLRRSKVNLGALVDLGSPGSPRARNGNEGQRSPDPSDARRSILYHFPSALARGGDGGNGFR
jgi:hypothetical protein